MYIDFIQMTKDQKKFMFNMYTDSDEKTAKTLLIFNFDGNNYSLSQKIKISDFPGATCRLSEDDSIISCFGFNLQFGTFIFDKSLDQYVNISTSNIILKQFDFRDAFFDSNNYLTATN